MKFRGMYTLVRIVKITLVLAIMVAVYYKFVVLAAAGRVYWAFLIVWPLFAVYCLHYEAMRHMITIRENSISIVMAKGGGVFLSWKMPLTYLPFKDIAEYMDYGKMIAFKMTEEVVLVPGGMFSKQVATDTFYLRPADKAGFLAALEEKGLKAALPDKTDESSKMNKIDKAEVT